MTHILSSITNFVVNIISAWGYAGVAFLMAIESAAIPLPSEIIAPFAGYLVFTGRFSLFWVAIAGGVGSAIGSAIIYWIGFRIGRPLIVRYGKYILISEHDLNLADKFFAKYGSISTFIGRLLPVVRTFISVPAGIERVPFWRFLIYSFIGSVIWTYLLAFIGMKLGQNWSTLHDRFRNFDVVIVALIVVGIIWFVWRHIKHVRQGH